MWRKKTWVCSLTLYGSQSASAHQRRASSSKRRGAEEQKGGQSKGKRYVVLHTIKYAFAKWYSILPFERFMHCLGSGSEEEEEEAGWLLVVEEVLSNGAKQEC